MSDTSTDDARLRDLVAPLAHTRDLELVDVAACQDLSRELSGLLDDEDPIDGRYALEVTSPGIDHPLRDRAAFDRVEGREVVVHRLSSGGQDAPDEVRGTVARAEDDGVVLDVDGESVTVAYAEIVTAKQALPW